MAPAFTGSPEIKQALLTAFDSMAESSAMVPSLSTLLKDTSSGYPEALTRYLDQLVATITCGMPPGESVPTRDKVRQCVADTTPGADLSGIPSRLLTAILSDMDTRAGLREHAPALQDILLNVIELQQRRAAGSDIAGSEWAAIRRRALALTDQFDKPALRHIGNAVESAAWDPATSGGVLIDVVNSHIQLLTMDAGADTGWTQADNQRALAMLQSIYDETQEQRDAGEDISIPALFRARDPELAAGYEQSLGGRKRGAVLACQALLDHVLTLLADAPVTAPEAVGA